MLLCRYHLIGALTLIHISHSIVLLTANIDDVKKIARKFVPEPLAQQIAEFIAKASSNAARGVSEENEQNAEDIKQLSESEQETFIKAARQGKPNYVTRETTPKTAQEDTASIESTTPAIKTKPRKIEANQWQWHGMNVIPLGRDNKKNLNQEHPNVLRELRPNRLEKKRQYWKHQKNNQMEKAHVHAGGEDWQKGEKNWIDRHSRDHDWQERLQETTERYIYKPKMQENEPQPQEEKLLGKRQKWSKVKTKYENWPLTKSKREFAENEHEVINPADYDLHTSELDLTNKEQTVSDYEATPDAFERVKERKRQRKANKNNREKFALENFEPKAKETEDSTPRIDGFNIENELTTLKERNEFDQYDNLKYKNQYNMRSQLVATSGNVMLEKLQDTKPAQMPTEPLELPKVEPQAWYNNKEEEKVQ